jgi:hypothetical protein
MANASSTAHTKPRVPARRLLDGTAVWAYSLLPFLFIVNLLAAFCVGDKT